jgi:hypothetical protein
MQASERQPAFVTATAPDPHFIGSRYARTHMACGLVNEAKHPKDAAGDGNLHSNVVHGTRHRFSSLNLIQ